MLHGIMITKNDEKILGRWLARHCHIFETISVVDGSTNSQTKELALAYPNVIYNRDPAGLISDQTLRKAGWDALEPNVRRGDWVFLCHPDEFYFHDPRKFLSVKEVLIRWIALHILPHPSEKEEWLKAEDQDPTKIFMHYWWKKEDIPRYKFWRSANVPTYETRMFRYVKDVLWDVTNPEPSSLVIPMNYSGESVFGRNPIYKHYKIYSLDLDDYVGTKFKNSSLNTQIGGREIKMFDDFFFDQDRPWGHKNFLRFSNDSECRPFNKFSRGYALGGSIYSAQSAKPI